MAKLLLFCLACFLHCALSLFWLNLLFGTQGRPGRLKFFYRQEADGGHTEWVCTGKDPKGTNRCLLSTSREQGALSSLFRLILMVILLGFPLEKRDRLDKEELNDSSRVIQMVSVVAICRCWPHWCESPWSFSRHQFACDCPVSLYAIRSVQYVGTFTSFSRNAHPLFGAVMPHEKGNRGTGSLDLTPLPFLASSLELPTMPRASHSSEHQHTLLASGLTGTECLLESSRSLLIKHPTPERSWVCGNKPLSISLRWN